MFRRAAFWILAAVSPLLAEPGTPQVVEEYRVRLQAPGGLAAELMQAVPATVNVTEANLREARAEVAFDAKRTPEEIDTVIEMARVVAQQRAEMSVTRRSETDPEADAAARREGAQAWAEVAALQFIAGAPKEALAAERKRMECLATVAAPEEWLEASLTVMRSLHWGGQQEAAASLFGLAKRMTNQGGLLENSAAAQARLLAGTAWLAARDGKTPLDEWTALTRQAVEALEKELGPAHRETLAALQELGAGVKSQGARREITGVMERLIAAQEKALGPDHPATVRSVAALGTYYVNIKELGAGYPYLRRAFDAWQRGAGVARADRLEVGNNAAIRERQNGDYEQAEKTYRQLIEVGTIVLGPEDRDLLWYRNDLAMVLSGKGDAAGAEKLSREVGEIRARVFGPEDSETLSSRNNTAVYLRAQGRYREAEQIFRAVLPLQVKVKGATYQETLRTKTNIAHTCWVLGEYEEAEKLAREALEQRTATLGIIHVDTLTSRRGLARILLAKGDLAGAEQSARMALEGRQQINGEDHPATIEAIETLAAVLAAKGESPKALEMLYRGVTLAENRFGADAPATISMVRALGAVQLQAEDLAGAETALQRARAATEKRLGREHPESIEITGDLGKLRAQQRDATAAEPLLRRALAEGEGIYDKEHPFVAEMAWALADLLNQKGRADQADEARALAERAAAIAKKKMPENQRVRERYDALVAKLGGKVK